MAKSILEQEINRDEQSGRVFNQEELIIEVAEGIWEALEQKGWNKAELAKALGKSQPDVTQLLNGGRNMTLRTLADISFALGQKVKVSFVRKSTMDERWETFSAKVVKHPAPKRCPWPAAEPITACA